MKKKFNNDIIFLIGIFLLPFENFFFAPSFGWATVTPIIFAIYILFNLDIRKMIEKAKDEKAKKIFLVFILLILFNIIAFCIVGINIKNFINACISIGLGFVNLISMYIYYDKNKTINKVVKLAIISYSITLAIGIIEFIAIKFDIKIIYDFFNVMFKRNYLKYDRIQFFFTEPSFIGMHIFGILLPLYLFSKDKKVLALIIAYSILSVVFKSGVRIIIDIVVICAIFGVYYIISKKKYALLIVLTIVLGIFGKIGYDNNDRIRKIVDKGIYADGSLASRYFRIQSSVYGYINDFPQVLLGYGIGNSLKPLRSGYNQAVEKYESTYMREVRELGDPEFNDDSVTYCLYIRFISEFGLIFFIGVLWYLIKITRESDFKYKWPYLLSVMYIYLQFESYAFYSIWIYILCMCYTKKLQDTTEKGELNEK